MEQMKLTITSKHRIDFFRPIFRGSLHVEGPCHLDPSIMSAEHLLPQLPKWKSRWVNGYDHKNEPCRRAIQVFDLNVSSVNMMTQWRYMVYLHLEMCETTNNVITCFTTRGTNHISFNRALRYISNWSGKYVVQTTYVVQRCNLSLDLRMDV